MEGDDSKLRLLAISVIGFVMYHFQTVAISPYLPYSKEAHFFITDHSLQCVKTNIIFVLW